MTYIKVKNKDYIKPERWQGDRRFLVQMYCFENWQRTSFFTCLGNWQEASYFLRLFIMRDVATVFHDVQFRAWNCRQNISALFHWRRPDRFVPRSAGQAYLAFPVVDRLGETSRCFVAKRRENGALETAVLHLNTIYILKYFDMFRIEKITCNSLNNSIGTYQA